MSSSISVNQSGYVGCDGNALVAVRRVVRKHPARDSVGCVGAKENKVGDRRNSNARKHTELAGKLGYRNGNKIEPLLPSIARKNIRV